MSFVIRKSVVAQSLEQLRSQPTHATFAGYLHLQQRVGELGRLDNLQPDFKRFFDRFFKVNNHPIGTPYIKPFTHQRPSINNLWLNENVAGSYAPSSIRAGQPFSKVVNISKQHGYSLPVNHAERALEHLLGGKRISLVSLAVFLYRDYGFKNPSVINIFDAFSHEFSYYQNVLLDDLNHAFYTLYDVVVPDQWSDSAFEGSIDDSEESTFLPSGEFASPLVTKSTVRELGSEELLSDGESRSNDHPPLQELRVKGLLSFNEESSFEFGRLNILVGPNGSGKSNLIDCLRIFRYAPLDIQQVFLSGGFEAWLHNSLDKQSGSGFAQLVTSVPGLPVWISHQLRLGPPSHSRARLEELIHEARDSDNAPYFVGSFRSQPVLSVQGSGKRRREKEINSGDYNPFRSILSQVRDFGQYPEITRLANLYSSIRIYSEWSFGRNSKLREAAPGGRSDTSLSEDMHDLPVVLNALEQTPAHEEILRMLPELKETYRDYVTRLLFGRVGLELVETPFKAPVPADRLSDGTLRFLALAAILLQPNPPPVICIEEPELGMHPDMIRMVARMMSDAAAKTQLIISTHSEHLLTALQDDFDVLFAFNAGPTGSVFRQFSKEEFVEWSKEHTLGELWTSGELGGNRW